MDECPQNSLASKAWQATQASLLRDISDAYELANTTSTLCHQTVRKEFTMGALVMLFLILLFVILTLIRSAVNVCETHNAFGKERHSALIKRTKRANDGAKHTEEEKKSYETSSDAVFLTNLRRFLDFFCIKSNVRKIFNNVSTEEQISCLHGIRGIVVIWVLIGHICVFYMRAIKTPAEARSIMESQATQILKNTIFIIDAFLVLGGFLNGYLFSQRYEKSKGKISWTAFYLHRLIRISPMHFMTLGFYTTLFSYLGSGPVWPIYNTNPVCRENWWWHVLYISNFNSHMKQCLVSTWYLSCEMQLYIISPIFLISFVRRSRIGYVLSALGILGSCFINFRVTEQYKLIDGMTRLGDYYYTNIIDFHERFWEYFEILYAKPYSRLGSFLIGMALGCYLFQKKDAKMERQNKFHLSLGWFITAVFFWISMFALYGREESVFETAVYNGLKHLLFSLCVAWIIFVSVTGHRGFVKKFLSSKFFIVISRLSYSIYLVNIIILEWYFLSMEELIDHSAVSLVILNLQLIFTIIAVSFVVSLVFEAPMLRITSLLFTETKQEAKSCKEE